MDTQIKESHIQPIWHVLVLNLLTMCCYVPFWLYKNYKELKRRADGVSDRPYTMPPLTIYEATGLRLIKRFYPSLLTLFSLMPVIGPVTMIVLFKASAELYTEKDSFIRKRPTVAGIIMALLTFAILSFARLPAPYYLLYLLVVIPVCICQHWLNCYWKSVEPADEGLLVRQSFSSIELVLLIFGIGLDGMIILQNFFIGK